MGSTNRLTLPYAVGGHVISTPLYLNSWGVYDLGANLPRSLMPIADLRTNAAYKLSVELLPAPKSIIGTALNAAITGGNFQNQPAGASAVTVQTSSALDIGKTVTIYGNVGTSAYVLKGIYELTDTSAHDITLEDGTAMATWGSILGVEISSAAEGTITIRKKDGGGTITTIAPTGTSSGVTAVAAALQPMYGLPFAAAGNDTTTKHVGVVGTDSLGNEIYADVPLVNTTVVYGMLPLQTVTKLLTGAVESTRTVAFTIGHIVWQAAGDTLTANELLDVGHGRIISVTDRYVHWCLTTAKTPINGGVDDWLKLKWWK